MCGIAGIVDFKGRKIEQSTLKAMCDSLAHRGPDGEGSYENVITNRDNQKVSLALGHRRLSIIDLETGKQPIYNEDRSIAVVYNGEIYNFKELRAELENKGHAFKTNSDTEVIVHLYEEKGERFVEYLRGMYSIALWDEREEKLILARDCFGKKPLLYAYADNRVVFASEFQALLQEKNISKEVDYISLDRYISHLCIPAPDTIYRSIKKVKPANMVIFKNGEMRETCYWQLDFRKKIKISEPEAKEELLKLLKEAVKIRLISDVPLGVFLSGGVDSSIVVALMSLVSPEKVKTFSIGFNESRYNELPFARIIAKKFDTEHHEFIVEPRIKDLLPKLVRHFGEPYADSSAVPAYYLSQMASGYVKVALNGDGGDEAFIGYKHYLANAVAEKLSRLPGPLRTKIIFSLLKPLIKNANYNSASGHLYRFLEAMNLPAGLRYKRWVCFYNDKMKQDLYSTRLQEGINGVRHEDLITAMFSHNSDLNIIDLSLLTDILIYLPSDLLVKMDISSMANSLETRSPFLDKYVMAFMASLPVRIKMKNFRLKYLLKSTMKDIVPHKNLYRDKRGFAVPIGSWLKKELRPYLSDMLLASDNKIGRIFNMPYVKALVRQHLEGHTDYSHHLWILLMLEMWGREFGIDF